MKVIGILRVKDEGDLLPSVLANVADGVDEIFAYEDESVDNTREILQAHPKVTYLKTYDPTFRSEWWKTHHLEKMVKQSFPEYRTEEVWVALLAGDLYWLNQSPREAAERAAAKGHDLKTGCAINFSIHHTDTWEGKDTWPKWKPSLRESCRWARVIEELPVVWKVADYTKHKRLPWPRHFKNRDTGIKADMPFLEHQGKRSPRFQQHRVLRYDADHERPRGTTFEQFQDIKWVEEWGRSKGYWQNPEAVPWIGLETIETLLQLEEIPEGERKIMYAVWDTWYDQIGRVLPPRTDI
jgi:hypothetical protein